MPKCMCLNSTPFYFRQVDIVASEFGAGAGSERRYTRYAKSFLLLLGWGIMALLGGVDVMS